MGLHQPGESGLCPNFSVGWAMLDHMPFILNVTMFTKQANPILGGARVVTSSRAGGPNPEAKECVY